MDYSNLGNELSSAVEQLLLWFYFKEFLLPIIFLLFMIITVIYLIRRMRVKKQAKFEIMVEEEKQKLLNKKAQEMNVNTKIIELNDGDVKNFSIDWNRKLSPTELFIGIVVGTICLTLFLCIFLIKALALLLL